MLAGRGGRALRLGYLYLKVSVNEKRELKIFHEGNKEPGYLNAHQQGAALFDGTPRTSGSFAAAVPCSC